MALLKVEGISRREHGLLSVNNISFSLEPFRKMAIAGETGSGKTSLLKMMAGLLQPEKGTILFEGKRVLGPEQKLMPGHPGIGYLSQHFELRNNYRVEDELEAKNELSTEESAKIFSVCRIEHLLKRMTSQISGGEKQRIALARVLIASPRLILLDEPFSNLDMSHKLIMKEVVKEISLKLGITCLMVLHDAPDILSWADTILVMKDGELIQQGNPENIYRQPVNEYCAGLFGAYNIVENLSVLSSINGIIRSRKKLMVRPENIRIAPGPENAAQGIVAEILYWGSYFSVDVMIREEKLRLYVPKPSVHKGDAINITMSPNDIWYW
jgi:ABC-type Fe3+/spermidine/putrescine transport system ATPase subunit